MRPLHQLRAKLTQTAIACIISSGYFLASLLASCAHQPTLPAPNNLASETTGASDITYTRARLQTAIPKYAQLANLPWPPLHIAKPIYPGTQAAAIPEIRHKLKSLGDLPTTETQQGNNYDVELVHAVKHFQWRHGIKPDGVIGQKTVVALNVSPATRLHQIQLNIKRFSEIPHHAGERYIHVNIPNYHLELIEHGQKILEMGVVVGKPKRPTPVLYSKVQTMVFNPKWNIPSVITNQDILPKLANNPNYLAQHNIKMYSSWKKGAEEINPNSVNWQQLPSTEFPYKLSQAPGPTNPLGRIKFIFVNQHDVYLHDTPQKHIFNRIQRAYSSGCIRLEKPLRLVEYFVQQSDTLEQNTVEETLENGQNQYVNIRDPIPIYITYITAWADKNGSLHFREDIYQKDNILSNEKVE